MRPIAIRPSPLASVGTLALAVTLLSLLLPAVAESQTEPCATAGAVEDAATNPGLLSDCVALLAARDKLAGDASLNWSASTPIGRWEGLTLDESPPRVTQLSLRYGELTGELPSELGHLSRLTGLYLLGNDLTGAIPVELGSLSELQELHLGENDLTGPIPDELASLTKLTQLGLSYNDLIGVVPSWLGSLAELYALELSGNELTGSIPPELGNLSKLRYLSLEYNMLRGVIPSELGGLANLENLDLDGNELTGRIPSEIGGLSKLIQLQLSENEFTGDIPTSLAALSNLEWLDLGLNNFTGEIPAELGDLTELFYLDLGGNRLTGSLPDGLRRLAKLQGLSLSGNQLTGTIPAWLGELSELRSLSLSHNRLTGRLPEELATLHYLDTLFLGNNRLEGQIPSWLGELANLRLLYLNANLFTGELPATLADLTNLGAFSVADNDLTGCVPAALSRVHRLAFDNTGLSFCLEQEEAGTIRSALLTVGEGETLLIDASVSLAAGEDPEGTAFEISSVGNAINGTVSLEGTTITYVHDGSETTTGGFTYTFVDGANTSSGRATITVRPINDPPVAGGDTAAVNEGETLLFDAADLLANDSDVEGDLLRVLEVRDASNGTVRLAGNTITYVHDGSETATGGFTYVLGDGLRSSIGRVTITVRPVNDPPAAAGDTAAVDEGETLLIETADLLANDSDAEGDALLVLAVGDAASGTVELAGTRITYVHDGSETTTGGFTYTVSDGNDAATAAVIIAVRPVNDPPAAAGDNAAMDEGGTLQIQTPELLVNDSDAEAETLNVSAVGESVNGTVRLDGTTVTYVHDGSETTSGAFEYTVSDGVDTATATVTITVRPVNDPPTAVDDIASVDEGETLVLEESDMLLNDSDAEGGLLSLSAVGDAINGTVSLDGTTITYVHDGSETTSGAFAYTVSDGVDTATAAVMITVRPVNDPPTAVDDIASVDEGETLVLEESVLLFNDGDADGALRVSGVGNAINGTVRLDGTSAVYVHDGSETTSGSFAYTVSDGVDTATATVTITVRPVNDPPAANDDIASMDEGQTLLLEASDLLVNDSDAEGQALSVSAVGDAINGTVRLDGTAITYEHDGSKASPVSFTYTVSDGAVTATATVTITVRPVNDPPTAVGDTAVVEEGETLLLEQSDLLANDGDAEGGALKISVVGEAVSGTVRLDGTRIIYVHNGSETTSGSFAYTVSDGMDTATATVTIAVIAVNDPPVAVGDTAAIDEGGTLQILASKLLANDSDAEGEALSISAVAEAVNGTVRLDGTTIIYVHDGSETTSGAFAYTVSDGVDTATAIVTIIVRPVNDPPAAVGDTAAIDEGETLRLEESELLANDSDAEGVLRISAVGQAVNGTVSLDGSTITYVHDGSETSTGGFVYTVSDGVDTATAKVTINIRSVIDLPVMLLLFIALGAGLVAAVILAAVIAVRRSRRFP